MSNLSILVVDDAAFIREMVRKTLKSRFPSISVDEAVDGAKARDLLAQRSFDLILCDWEMPELSGIELLTWLRKDQGNRTPFVMVTSRGDKENVVEAVQAGVNDYIGKPFSQDKLLGKVSKVLGKNPKFQQLMGSQGPATGSVSALTGGSAAPAKPTAKSPAVSSPLVSSAPKPAAKSEAKMPTGKGVAHLRFGDNTNECIIKAISLKQFVLISRSQDGLPAILENVVVDVQQANSGEVARINGYVHQLQANEPKMDSALVNITINIIDNDPNKLAFISKIIAKGTSAGFVPGAARG